jgi:hypothetical protein
MIVRSPSFLNRSFLPAALVALMVGMASTSSDSHPYMRRSTICTLCPGYLMYNCNMVIPFHLFHTKTDIGPDKGILNIGLYVCALTLALRVPHQTPTAAAVGAHCYALVLFHLLVRTEVTLPKRQMLRASTVLPAIPFRSFQLLRNRLLNLPHWRRPQPQAPLSMS